MRLLYFDCIAGISGDMALGALIHAGVDVDALRTHLAAADFWNMPGDPSDDERGLDGADWVIEGRRNGVYHSVIRWEPRPGPFRTACEDFIALSSICPHLGCKVHWETQNQRFFCPCHNGAFSAAGVSTAGPPFDVHQNLARFPLKVENGNLFIEVPVA